MAWGSLIERALSFAVERHQGVWRDGEHPVPYACHPVEVMLNLRHLGGVVSEPVLAAALLHDLVEDTETSLAEIEELFGDEVSGLVDEVTRDEPSEEEKEGKSKQEIWEIRNGMLMEEIRGMSDDAKRIKLADRLSNIREAKLTRSGHKLERYVRQTRQILELIDRAVAPELWDLIEGELVGF